MQASAADIIPPLRAKPVLGLAVAICLSVACLRFADTGAALLDLRPLLDAPQGATGLSRWTEDLFVSAALGSRMLAATMCGLAAALAFLVIEQTLRRHAKLRNETAALLGAAAFSALPIGACFARLSGGPPLLLAFGIACTAVLLAPHWCFASMALCVLLPFLHPLGAVLMLWPLLALIGAGRNGAAALLLLVAIALALSGFAPLTEPTEGIDDRWAAAGQTFLAAPALAIDRSVRTLLPTGAEWVRGTLPVAQGTAVWLLLLGLACMVGRFRLAMPLTIVALVAAHLAPWFVPTWIPGDAGTVCITCLPLVLLGVLVLGPVAGRWWREMSLGLALGLIAIAVVGEYQVRGLKLALRRHALGIAQRTSPAVMFAPDLETDPLRLVLYMEDMVRFAGRLDPQVLTCGLCAENLLQQPTPSALQPARLKARVAALLEAPGSIPVDAPASEAWMFEKLPALSTALDIILLRLNTEGPERAYQSSADELVAMVPSLVEILVVRAQHPKVHQFQQHALDAMRVVAQMATRLGDLRVSLPLREAIVAALSNEPRAAAIFGRELVEAGRFDEAVPVLETALSALKGKDILWCVSKGALGRAVVPAAGAAAGLEHMDAAWGGFLGGSGSAGQRLGQITDPDGLDYWLVVELLLARFEATRIAHPERAVQARADVLRALDGAQSTGNARMPALLVEGRVAQLDGELSKARRVLREARALRCDGLVERGDGARGRLDFPRYRVAVLQSLLLCLDAPESATGMTPEAQSERAAVQAELNALLR